MNVTVVRKSRKALSNASIIPRSNHEPCNALNPCNGTLELPVTNCNNRARISSLYDSTICQNHLTTGVSGVQCCKYDVRSLLRMSQPWVVQETKKAHLQTSILFPVLNIDRHQSAYDQFQLSFVERFEQLRRHDLRKTFIQGQELLFDAPHESVIDVQSATTEKVNITSEKQSRITLHKRKNAHFTYSLLFSSVTWIFWPPAFSS